MTDSRTADHLERGLTGFEAGDVDGTLTLPVDDYRPPDHERPLRVGLIAPPWVPVPPPEYGGTELVVDNLARGLVKAGHEVRLFTTGDATCPVETRWLHEEALGTLGSAADELGHVQAAYQELADADVIHDHTLFGPLWALAANVKPAVVTTVHGPFSEEMSEHYRAVGRHSNVVCISEHQRRTGPTVPVANVIHHGIDVDSLPAGRGDGGFVLFLGRMHPTKGVHRAIDVARAAGKKLLIAAKMWEPAERRYFAEQVEPRLGADAEYIGQVGGQQKAELLGRAEALVNPIRWPEPFGLVMIEALAAGTPVLAFPEGAAPEIVDHGQTGFICRNDAEMVRRLMMIDRLDRDACRRAAESRFSTERMVTAHGALYTRLVAERDRTTGGSAPLGCHSQLALGRS